MERVEVAITISTHQLRDTCGVLLDRRCCSIGRQGARVTARHHEAPISVATKVEDPTSFIPASRKSRSSATPSGSAN